VADQATLLLGPGSAAFDLLDALGLVTVPAPKPSSSSVSRGGFSCILSTHPGKASSKRPLLTNGEVEDGHFPRIAIRGIDARRALISYRKPGAGKKDPKTGKPRPSARKHWMGVFVSLTALADALGAETPGDLASACSAFEVDLPQPGKGFEAEVERLRASCRLYRRLLELHRDLCPDRPPNSASSSGAYARALLRRAGLKPPLVRWPGFDRMMLDKWMKAYHAGELETHVRAPDLPVQTLDLGGAYGVSATLCGAFELLAAEEVDIRDENPRAVSAFVSRLFKKIQAFAAGFGPPPSSRG